MQLFISFSHRGKQNHVLYRFVSIESLHVRSCVFTKTFLLGCTSCLFLRFQKKNSVVYFPVLYFDDRAWGTWYDCAAWSFEGKAVLNSFIVPFSYGYFVSNCNGTAGWVITLVHAVGVLITDHTGCVHKRFEPHCQIHEDLLTGDWWCSLWKMIEKCCVWIEPAFYFKESFCTETGWADQSVSMPFFFVHIVMYVTVNPLSPDALQQAMNREW